MLEFVQFIRKRWQEISASNGQKGTTVDELAVKPTGIVLTDFYNKLVEAKTVNDVTQADTMTDGELDAFGGKFFMRRYQGSTASTIVRIRFNERKDITITSDIIAASDTGVTFKAAQTGIISKNNFIVSNDAFSLYYVDVSFVATSPGDIFNIEAGSVVRLDNALFDYISVTNPKSVINGSKYEDNDEYFDRLSYTLNDRSLMNKAGVYAFIRQLYPVVSSVNIQGSGDKYMTRDLVDAVSDNSKVVLMDYLGKTFADNSVKHYAATYIFPPKPDTNLGVYWGPHSSKTNYSYPLTISPVVESFQVDASTDAAFFGYDVSSEMTDEEYSGVFFNDYNNTTIIETTDLLNIRNEEVPYTEYVVSPNKDWVVGAHARSNGDFGQLTSDSKASDYLSFQGVTINLTSGAGRTLSAGKPIGKRTGLKTTGKFIWPDGDEVFFNSNLNVIIAGTDEDVVDAYSGIGFGVMLFKEYDPAKDANGNLTNPNAVAYFTNSAKYGETQVFAGKDDLVSSAGGTINIAGTNALYEEKIGIRAGEEYLFEFVIDDDLKLTLYIAKSTPDSYGNREEFRIELPSDVLMIFASKDKDGIYSLSSRYYGTTAKVSLVTDVKNRDYSWSIKDLLIADTNNNRATTLFSFDVTELNNDAILYLRAFASGYLGNGEVEGYTAYIWDKEGQNEVEGNNVLSQGAWTIMSGVSNQNGTKSIDSGLLDYHIRGIDRYIVDLNSGKRVYVMLVSSGTARAPMAYYGDYLNNVQSIMRVDYIKLESVNKDKFHSRNKADVYVVTVRSSELPSSIIKDITYSGGYAELSERTGVRMPIDRMLQVTINRGTNFETILSEADYDIYTVNPGFKNSKYEVSRMVLNTSYDPDNVTIEYIPYPDIDNIQGEFDSNQHEKVYGDILVKHSYAVYLDFNVQYTGEANDQELIDAIWAYVDSNNYGTFSINDMVRSLYSSGIVNNIKEPLTISYEKALKGSYGNTGSFDSTLTIKEIEYFIVRDLTVERV